VYRSVTPVPCVYSLVLITSSGFMAVVTHSPDTMLEAKYLRANAQPTRGKT